MTAMYKLGKEPPVVDKRTLRFEKYLTLPAPPASVSYYTKVATWPMYYNNKYGDCTCAAAAHMIQNWSANAATQIKPPASKVLAFYEHFVGSPPPPDEGCNMLSVLKYWRQAGLDKQKVTAFTSIDLKNRSQAESAIYLLGSIYIGVALPNFAVEGDMLTVPWKVPPGGPVGDAAPNPNNGHCIPAVGYDADQLWVVTWGELKSMGWDFYNAYADESFAVLSKDFLGKSGVSPAGLNLQALEADLAKL
jgi:hypothetical protein